MIVQVKSIGFVQVDKTARQRVAKAEANNLCCACMEPLDKTRTIRGCHERCYQATIRAIARGLTTDAERVKEGKLLPQASPGPKRSSPVSLDIAGAKP